MLSRLGRRRALGRKPRGPELSAHQAKRAGAPSRGASKRPRQPPAGRAFRAAQIPGGGPVPGSCRGASAAALRAVSRQSEKKKPRSLGGAGADAASSEGGESSFAEINAAQGRRTII